MQRRGPKLVKTSQTIYVLVKYDDFMPIHHHQQHLQSSHHLNKLFTTKQKYNFTFRIVTNHSSIHKQPTVPRPTVPPTIPKQSHKIKSNYSDRIEQYNPPHQQAKSSRLPVIKCAHNGRGLSVCFVWEYDTHRHWHNSFSWLCLVNKRHIRHLSECSVISSCSLP